MSGIAPISGGQQGRHAGSHATYLVHASTRQSGGNDPFPRGGELVPEAKQGGPDDLGLWRSIMGIDPQEDAFKLSSADVADLGLVGRRAELMSQLGDAGTADILKQINVRVQDLGNGDREIRFIRPPFLSYEEIFAAINSHPGNKQDGVLKRSNILAGFKEDILPTKPVEHIVIIHFGFIDIPRYEHEDFLGHRRESFVHPGDLAIAEAVRLAQFGTEGSLFRFNGNKFWVRTKETEMKNGNSVWKLHSNEGGVAGRYDDGSRPVVVCGSPKHKV